MDLHGIDLNLLVAFDALMSERSVTKAGRRIGRTQPAMSAALARLRSLLDDELFVRSQSGLQPTPRAIELSLPLGRALEDIQRTLGYTQQFDPRLSPITSDCRSIPRSSCCRTSPTACASKHRWSRCTFTPSSRAKKR